MSKKDKVNLGFVLLAATLFVLIVLIISYVLKIPLDGAI